MGRIEERVAGLAEEIAGALGVSLEGVELAGSGRRHILRVYIDKEGGVTIRDCELMSRELGPVLDVEDLIPGPYTLEVSSPGLDRPLKKPNDFKRQIGKLARVVTSGPVEGQTFFIGRLLEAADDSFMLRIEGRDVKIPYELVKKARLEVEI